MEKHPNGLLRICILMNCSNRCHTGDSRYSSITYLIVAHRICPDKPREQSHSCIVVVLIDANNIQVVEYRYDVCGTAVAKTGNMTTMLGTVNPFRYGRYLNNEKWIIVIDIHGYERVLAKSSMEKKELKEFIRIKLRKLVSKKERLLHESS